MPTSLNVTHAQKNRRGFYVFCEDHIAIERLVRLLLNKESCLRSILPQFAIKIRLESSCSREK